MVLCTHIWPPPLPDHLIILTLAPSPCTLSNSLECTGIFCLWLHICFCNILRANVREWFLAWKGLGHTIKESQSSASRRVAPGFWAWEWLSSLSSGRLANFPCSLFQSSTPSQGCLSLSETLSKVIRVNFSPLRALKSLFPSWALQPEPGPAEALHACNPSPWEPETGRPGTLSLQSSRPATVETKTKQTKTKTKLKSSQHQLNNQTENPQTQNTHNNKNQYNSPFSAPVVLPLSSPLRVELTSDYERGNVCKRIQFILFFFPLS